MKVPCNGCTECCKGDAIRLLPEESPKDYLTEPHPAYKNTYMLAHKPNKDCIYLGETGCTIHDRKPILCKNMDCRNIARNMSYTTARKLAKKNLLHFEIWRKGKDLCKLSEVK